MDTKLEDAMKEETKDTAVKDVQTEKEYKEITLKFPLKDDMDHATMESMVQEINSGVVSAEDKLSDYVFQYDSENHELVRMDKMEERKQEKEAAKSEIAEKTDKVENTDEAKIDKAKSEKAAPKKSSSLQDRISKKQTEVDQREATKPQPSKKRDVALA